METRDFLVIGGGVVGLPIARELKRRRPGASVALIDKEDGPSRHGSGRNSGVLHAGFYCTADSLKARFTRAGNLAWTDYCRERGLPLRACGKPGIRAQLMDIEKRILVMDFLLEGDSRSMHVLNAVSPGVNCAMPFAAHVCEGVDGMLKSRS